MNAEELQNLRARASQSTSIAELFGAEPARAKTFTIDACGLHADFSRQLISGELFGALLETVDSLRISEKFQAMFSGDFINITEQRRVLHVATRAHVDTNEWSALASTELQRASAFAESVRARTDIDAVINIGIGGSDLGPAMAARALRRHHTGPIVRFVSNIDAADLDAAIEGLNPQRTMFIVSSKTFTTQETMHNAERARAWVSSSGIDWTTRFAAATANPHAAVAWGIPEEQVFEFFDWVGGRFSLSSVIGLPLMCAIGVEQFNKMLLGMRDMDDHVISASPAVNLPIVHALIWFTNAVLLQLPTVAVVPYSHDLARLPAFLQQLVMESNGKRVAQDGSTLVHGASPVVWGEPGTNGQHAFFQMLHQGTQIVPVEFISSVKPLGDDSIAHDMLIANMIAQAEALSVGSASEDVQREFPGNRPNTVIMLDSLDAYSLGALIAMYEHSTAVQGWLMGVNSFDQFGVELGKSMAKIAANAIENGVAESGQTMTHPLMEWFLLRRENNS